MSNEGYMEGPGKGVFESAPKVPPKPLGASYQQPATQEQKSAQTGLVEERKVAVYAGGTFSRRVPESQVYNSTVKVDQDGRELFGD